jgi:acyl-CoA synthetase (AMP-forming)/AMP-acid ligase II
MHTWSQRGMLLAFGTFPLLIVFQGISSVRLARVTGKLYTDIVHIMGLIATGLVPQVHFERSHTSSTIDYAYQLFSSIFSPTTILGLLSQSKAKALVVDPEFRSDASPVNIPVFSTLDYTAFEQTPDVMLGELPKVLPTDPAVIVHSSGTTSGVPKLIVQSHQWVQSAIKDKWAGADPPGYSGQAVINSLGSLAHVGSFCGKFFEIDLCPCTSQGKQRTSAPSPPARVQCRRLQCLSLPMNCLR